MQEILSFAKMLCLHGKEATKSTTENGTFWFCNQPEKCHFSCSDEQTYIYDAAIKEFLTTKQSVPKCCSGEAKMKVVTDKKQNFGRPFFVCPIRKQNQQCNYFAWGDQTIVERPLCEHGKPSLLLTVKKQCPNKDRKFFACGEQKENQWLKEEPEDPLLPLVRRGNTVYTQSFWLSYHTY